VQSPATSNASIERTPSGVADSLKMRSHITRRSFDEDQDGPPAKRSRRSTARAMESAELEAMDVFGDKEDEEDR
jgi:hypothetical protein